MTATIGGLLTRLHHLAGSLDDWEVRFANRTEVVAAHALGWRALAGKLTAALNALPFAADSEGSGTRDAALGMIAGLASPPWKLNHYPLHPGLVEVGEVVGAIVDVLVDDRRAFRVEVPKVWWERSSHHRRPPSVYVPRPVNDTAAAGLQVSLLAALHPVAAWSLSRLPQLAPARPVLVNLHQFLAFTGLFTRVPAESRRSTLENLAAVGWREVSVEGAVHRWAREAEQALHRRLVTSGTFAMMASDLTILDAAIIHALKTTVTAPDLAWRRQVQHTLGEAHAAWQAVACWPTDLRLGGVRSHAFIDASRELRTQIADRFRGPDGWLTTAELGRTNTRDDLDALAYGLADVAARAGEAFSRSVGDMTIDQGRLWRSIDSAVELDPDTPTTRLFAVPNRITVHEHPLRWVIPHGSAEDTRELVATARTAAGHNHQAMERLEALLQPEPEHVIERIPSPADRHIRPVRTPTLGHAPNHRIDR